MRSRLRRLSRRAFGQVVLSLAGGVVAYAGVKGVGEVIHLNIDRFALGAAAAPASGPVRVGVLRTIDALPILAAERDGLFGRQNVDVAVAVFESAAERDGAFVAGELDLAASDIVATALLNRERPVARIVRTTYEATTEQAMYSLVIPASSPAKRASDLVGGEIIVVPNTAGAYTADRLIEMTGVRAAEVRSVGLPALAQLLAFGRPADALAPGPAVALIEPYTALALARGGRVLADDRGNALSSGVLVASEFALREKATSVQRFLAAHARAVEAVNANETRYRALPGSIASVVPSGATIPADASAAKVAGRDAAKLPVFPQRRVPSEDEVRGVVRWLVQRGDLNRPLRYGDLVDTKLGSSW